MSQSFRPANVGYKRERVTLGREESQFRKDAL